MKNPSLAIIEDDEDVRELIIAFFRPKNFKVSAFSDAQSFISSLDNEKGIQPDVIITDLMLPKIDGIELVKRLKEMNCEAPVILLTAEKSAEIAIRAIEAGAYDFVVKPMNFPQLQVSVERALHFGGIREENKSLKAAISMKQSANGIIGRSPGLMRAVDLARRVADSSANVFISGETGTGKEVIARAVHDLGRRASHPFIAINCSAIPENLLESELFGHAKGSFTGAAEKKIGLFEEAGEGTLFLDEVGDLSLPLQAKLLRTLQERKIKRIGENQFRPFAARIVSATHKNLQEEIREKNFREDLFFRLNVIPIHIPALRDRREDILPLAEFFLKKFSVLNAKPRIKGFDKGAIEFLLRAAWPGNVRELENSIERAVVLSETPFVSSADFCLEGTFAPSAPEPKLEAPAESVSSAAYLPPAGEAPEPNGRYFSVDITYSMPTLEELTSQYIDFAVRKNEGAKDKTAKELGIDRKTLYRKLLENEARAPALASGNASLAHQH